MLDNQQKTKEAVKAILNYFDHMDYEADLELMLNAQAQIMGLMELAKQQTANSHGGNELMLKTDDVHLFMQVVIQYLQLLKPFSEIAASSPEAPLDDNHGSAEGEGHED